MKRRRHRNVSFVSVQMYLSFDEKMEYLHLTPSSSVSLAVLLFEFFLFGLKDYFRVHFHQSFFFSLFPYLNVRSELWWLWNDWPLFYIRLNPFNFEHLLLFKQILRFFSVFFFLLAYLMDIQYPPLESIKTVKWNLLGSKSYIVYFILITFAEW